MNYQIENIRDAFIAYLHRFTESLPNFLLALTLLFVGWLAARFLSAMVIKLLRLVKISSLTKGKVAPPEILSKIPIPDLIGNLVYFITLLFFIVTASDLLGWQVISNQVNILINFLPTLFSGIFLFAIGYYIANFVSDIIKATTLSIGMAAGRALSGFAFYFILLITSLTALDQIGIDTTIIRSNLVVIIGAVMLAASVSYGIASRDVLSNMLASYFSRRAFTLGQTIKVDDVEGMIIRMESTYVVLQTPTEQVVIPTRELITKKVHITKQSPFGDPNNNS